MVRSSTYRRAERCGAGRGGAGRHQGEGERREGYLWILVDICGLLGCFFLFLFYFCGLYTSG